MARRLLVIWLSLFLLLATIGTAGASSGSSGAQDTTVLDWNRHALRSADQRTDCRDPGSRPDATRISAPSGDGAGRCIRRGEHDRPWLRAVSRRPASGTEMGLEAGCGGHRGPRRAGRARDRPGARPAPGGDRPAQHAVHGCYGGHPRRPCQDRWHRCWGRCRGGNARGTHRRRPLRSLRLRRRRRSRGVAPHQRGQRSLRLGRQRGAVPDEAHLAVPDRRPARPG